MIFLPCPICGKYPKVKTTNNTYNAICTISCRGLFKKHFEVRGMSYLSSEAEDEAGYAWNSEVRNFMRNKEKEKGQCL